MEYYNENVAFGQFENSHEEDVSESENINVGNFERIVSVAVGTLLLYNAFKKIRRKPIRSLSRAAVGGLLIARGATGNCPIYSRLNIDGTKTTSVNIRTSFTVNKPRSEVYAFWRRLENLPRFMKHLANVKEIDSHRSHWEAKIPENNPVSISWDAEIVKDEPGHLVSWQSLPGSTIENAGKVEFRDALGRRGTEIRVVISYRPPAGNIGSGIAKLFNPLFQKMVKEDIMNFKQYIEFRGIPQVEGFA